HDDRRRGRAARRARRRVHPGDARRPAPRRRGRPRPPGRRLRTPPENRSASGRPADSVGIMRLGSIHVYPVKSTRGLQVASAQVDPWGLAGDRRYMVVDADGMVLTARDHPRMLAVAATPEGRGLKLTGPHADPLQVSPEPGTPTRRVRIWHDDVDAVDTGEEAAAWFTALLGLPARLVWLDDPTRRPVDPAYGAPDDRVSFADAYPLLLASTASLRRLNDWIA